jgi:hypothetical protein
MVKRKPQKPRKPPIVTMQGAVTVTDDGILESRAMASWEVVTDEFPQFLRKVESPGHRRGRTHVRPTQDN